MIKKVLFLVILGTLLTTPVFAEIPVKIYMNGQEVSFEVNPQIEDGTTLVPFRTIFEKLGLKVSWNPDTLTVRGSSSTLDLQLQIGNKIATVNGLEVPLSVEPKIVDGSTLVPLRFISEQSGQDVTWYSNSKTITINGKHYMDKEEDIQKYNELAMDPEKVQMYLGVFANKSKDELNSLLRNYLVDKRDIEASEALLELGADSNLRNESDTRPLLYLIVNPWYSHSPDFPQRKKDFTKEQDVAAIKVVLNHQADPNLTGTMDSTHDVLLDTAIKYNQQEVVRLLLNTGESPNPTDKLSRPPLYAAIFSNKLVNSQYNFLYGDVFVYRNLELLTLLLENGANPNVSFTYRQDGQFATTPLEEAVQAKDPSTKSCSNGTCKELKDEWVPADLQIVKTLLKYGASVKDNSLYYAVSSRKPDLDIIKTLLNAGADPNKLDPFGNNRPIMYYASTQQIKELLQQYGGK